MSIEGIALEQFISLQNQIPFIALGHLSLHTVFYSLFSDDSKEDSVTTFAHSKHISKKLQNRQLSFVDIITI